MKEPLSPEKTFTRFVSEGAVIIISILLAFGIDAWWENLGDEREERQILSALHDELQSNHESLKKWTAWHTDIQDAILVLLAQASLSEASLTSDSIDILIGRASWFNNSATFEMSANDAIVLGGLLPLIQNNDLRQRITSWNREIDQVSNTEKQDYDTFSAVWMPFLREHGYLPQIDNAITDQPGTGDADYGSDVPLANDRLDHRLLLKNRQFQNVLLHRLWVQNDILEDYRELEPKILSMIDWVSAEIE